MDSLDTAKRILIVDRDVVSVELLRQGLRGAGFAVRTAAEETMAVMALQESPPHLAIVDWDQGTGPALEFIRDVLRVRAPETVRLIIVSSLSAEHDVVRGLSLGADDYIAKPFSLREAIARVCAVLRTRAREPASRGLAFDELVLDVSASRVLARGRSVRLRGTEYRLLEFLMAHPGRTFNRTQLLAQVWGGDREVDQRTVDVNVQRLRKTLGERGYGAYIQTIRGFGYCFMRPSSR
ncbi:MAG: winged helix-turn-helix domain-containing protein [Steroidobacteraceae bacterium]|jgi:two-component system phosphate regulon response regulator PhoB